MPDGVLLRFLRGSSTQLPQQFEDGTIYVCTDTGEMILGVGTNGLPLNVFDCGNIDLKHKNTEPTPAILDQD